MHNTEKTTENMVFYFLKYFIEVKKFGTMFDSTCQQKHDKAAIVNSKLSLFHKFQYCCSLIIAGNGIARYDFQESEIRQFLTFSPISHFFFHFCFVLTFILRMDGPHTWKSPGYARAYCEINLLPLVVQKCRKYNKTLNNHISIEHILYITYTWLR